MNGRTAIMGHLRDTLPTKFKVAGPRGLDALEANRPAVMVIRTNLAPLGGVLGSYLSTFAIWVIEPKQITPEDDLDAALDAVILALDAYDYVAWTDAERSTYNDQPAYRITANTIDKKE